MDFIIFRDDVIVSVSASPDLAPYVIFSGANITDIDIQDSKIYFEDETFSYEYQNLEMTNVNNTNVSIIANNYDQTFSLYNLVMLIVAIPFTTAMIVGNSMVILAWIMDSSIRSYSNAWLVALAFADLSVGVLVVPFGFYAEITHRWDFGIQFCQFWLDFAFAGCFASSTNLVLIAVDRFRVLFQGLKYLQTRKLRNVVYRNIIIWIVGLAVGSPVIWSWDSTAMDPTGTKLCVSKKTWFCVVLVNFLNILLPSALMVFLYGKIYCRLKKRLRAKENARITTFMTSSRLNTINNMVLPTYAAQLRNVEKERYTFSMQTSPGKQGRLSTINVDQSRPESLLSSLNVLTERRIRRERKSIVTLGILIGCFLCCWIPYTTVTMLTLAGVRFPKILYLVLALVGWFNSCINPIIYSFRNNEFKTVWSRWFKRVKRRHGQDKELCRISELS